MSDQPIRRQIIVASAFIHRDGKLLVAKRAETERFLPGIFEIPGGKVEFGETMEEGVAREIREEMGIEVAVGEPFHVFTYANESRHAVEVDYFCSMIDPSQPIILDPKNHSEYRWIGPDEIDDIFTLNERQRLMLQQTLNHSQLPANDPVREAVAKGFALLAQQEMAASTVK